MQLQGLPQFALVFAYTAVARALVLIANITTDRT